MWRSLWRLIHTLNGWHFRLAALLINAKVAELVRHSLSLVWLHWVLRTAVSGMQSGAYSPGQGLLPPRCMRSGRKCSGALKCWGRGVNVCDPYLWHNIHPAATGGVSLSTSRGHPAIFLTFPLPQYNSIITQSLSPLFAFLLFLFSFLVFSAQVQR